MLRIALVLPLLIGALTACSENGIGIVPLPDTGDTGEAAPVDPADDSGEAAAILEPVADAGVDRFAKPGDLVVLDGRGSYDPAGLEPLDYEWTLISRPGGSGATMSSPLIAQPGFVADVVGSYTFDLVVRNSAGVWDSSPDRVAVEVQQDAVAEPVADAGPDRSGAPGVAVTLDGSASYDPGGLTPLTWRWRVRSRPTGSTAGIASTGAVSPSFTPDVDGVYVIDLSVGNSAGVWDSTPDEVTVTASTPVLEPVADAGPDQIVGAGASVALDGTKSSDPAGLVPLQYQWTLVAKPSGSGAAIGAPTAPTPSFGADRPGDYVIDLTVRNSAGVWDSTPDRVVVTATEPAAPAEPVANAGPDQGVKPLATVTLDGAASYDPGGLSPLQYQWTLIGRPSGSTTSLSGATSAKPSFFADLAGDYTFDLTVRNTAGVWDSTPDRVVVTATPADGFYVEVSWDNSADLDLHVLNGSSALYRAGDCNWCNMAPDWGAPGSADDPSLDWDSILGYGPETVTIGAPATGSYTVKVHYYGEDGYSSCAWGWCLPAKATVRVYLGGLLAATYTRTLNDQGDLWNVATISWPSGAITKNDKLEYTSEIECR